MGATSVTGVGPGDAFPGIKGPGNGRNIYVSLLTPHVVKAGSATLASGTATVTFSSALSGSEANYVVMVTSTTSAAAFVGTKTDDSDGNFISFVITGTGTDVIMWSVISAVADGNA